MGTGISFVVKRQKNSEVEERRMKRVSDRRVSASTSNGCDPDGARPFHLPPIIFQKAVGAKRLLNLRSYLDSNCR